MGNIFNTIWVAIIGTLAVLIPLSYLRGKKEGGNEAGINAAKSKSIFYRKMAEQSRNERIGNSDIPLIDRLRQKGL